MKNNFLAIIATAAIALGSLTNASAQNSVNLEILGANSRASDSKVTNVESGAASSFASSKVGSRALKSFSKFFKNATNAEWYPTDDGGFIATFYEGNSKTNAVYNSKGQFNYSVKRLAADQLPTDITRDVQAAFNAHNIICGEEIRVDNSTIYLVHIKTDRNAKTIRICKDEMEVIEDLNSY